VVSERPERRLRMVRAASVMVVEGADNEPGGVDATWLAGNWRPAGRRPADTSVLLPRSSS
jgi:hypothetical protein